MIHQIILAYCILTTCIVESTTYGLVGGTVTLNTNIKDIPDDILWKHNGNKVVEVDGQKQNAFGSFLNRITLDRSSADLTITDLSYEDSGEYVLEIYNKALTRYNHNLEVIDKVAKPTISCKMNTNSSSSTSANQATLMCSSEPGQFQSLMKFDWSSHEKSGQDVTISLGDQHDDQVYTCTVSNPVSKESTTFTAKDCYKGDDPGALDAIIVSGIGIGIGIAFVILLLLALLFCKLKHKACFAEGNDEKRASYCTTEGSTNGEKESFLNHSERQECNDDTEEECWRPVHQRVKQYEAKTGQQKQKEYVSQDRESTENKVSQCDPAEPKKANVVSPGELKNDTLPSRNDEEDTDVSQDTESTENKVPESDPTDLQKTNDVLPAALNDNRSKNGEDESLLHQSERKESNDDTEEDSDKKEGNGEEEKPALANPVSPRSVQPCSPLTTEPVNMLPKDDAGEHKEDSNSHQVTGKTKEEIDDTPQISFHQSKKVFESNSGGQKPSVPAKKPQNPSTNVKEDTDNDPADPQKANVGLPGTLNDDKSGTVQRRIQQIERWNEQQKPEDSDKKEEPVNMLPKEDADEHKEDGNSHQVTGETQEKTSDNMTGVFQEPTTQTQQNHGKRNPPVSKSEKKADEDEETITASANAPSAVQPLSEDDEQKEDANPDQDSDITTTTKNAEESEPSGNRLEEETTSPEQKDAEATVHEPKQADMETHSVEDNQQDRHKNVSKDNNEPDVDEESNETGSLLTPEPDHINTNTCQESSGTEQAASDLEKKSNRDSGNRTEETDKESKTKRSGNVHQRVQRIESMNKQQKPEVPAKKPRNPSTNVKEDTDNDPADPQKANVVLPGALNDDISESDKNADEDKETITASANAPSAVQPLSEDDENKEDANSDQDSDKTTTKKNADSSGLQEGHECNRLGVETTSPGQKGAESTDVETHSGEDNQQDSH